MALIDRIDFCNYAMTINGQVQNQVGAYIGGADASKANFGHYTNVISDALGLEANVSISQPVLREMGHANIIQHMFDSSILTVTVFMVLVAAQLVYSLML